MTKSTCQISTKNKVIATASPEAEIVLPGLWGLNLDDFDYVRLKTLLLNEVEHNNLSDKEKAKFYLLIKGLPNEFKNNKNCRTLLANLPDWFIRHLIQKPGRRERHARLITHSPICFIRHLPGRKERQTRISNSVRKSINIIIKDEHTRKNGRKLTKSMVWLTKLTSTSVNKIINTDKNEGIRKPTAQHSINKYLKIPSPQLQINGFLFFQEEHEESEFFLYSKHVNFQYRGHLVNIKVQLEKPSGNIKVLTTLGTEGKGETRTDTLEHFSKTDEVYYSRNFEDGAVKKAAYQISYNNEQQRLYSFKKWRSYPKQNRQVAEVYKWIEESGKGVVSYDWGMTLTADGSWHESAQLTVKYGFIVGAIIQIGFEKSNLGESAKIFILRGSDGLDRTFHNWEQNIAGDTISTFYNYVHNNITRSFLLYRRYRESFQNGGIMSVTNSSRPNTIFLCVDMAELPGDNMKCSFIYEISDGRSARRIENSECSQNLFALDFNSLDAQDVHFEPLPTDALSIEALVIALGITTPHLFSCFRLQNLNYTQLKLAYEQAFVTEDSSSRQTYNDHRTLTRRTVHDRIHTNQDENTYLYQRGYYSEKGYRYADLRLELMIADGTVSIFTTFKARRGNRSADEFIVKDEIGTLSRYYRYQFHQTGPQANTQSAKIYHEIVRASGEEIHYIYINYKHTNNPVGLMTADTRYRIIKGAPILKCSNVRLNTERNEVQFSSPEILNRIIPPAEDVTGWSLDDFATHLGIDLEVLGLKTYQNITPYNVLTQLVEEVPGIEVESLESEAAVARDEDEVVTGELVVPQSAERVETEEWEMPQREEGVKTEEMDVQPPNVGRAISEVEVQRREVRSDSEELDIVTA